MLLWCDLLYLALVINSTCGLELPLLSITVDNCRRKTETTQKPCCAPGIKHNMKKKKATSAPLLSWNQQQSLELLVKICSLAVMMHKLAATQWFWESEKWEKMHL